MLLLQYERYEVYYGVRVLPDPVVTGRDDQEARPLSAHVSSPLFSIPSCRENFARHKQKQQ